MSKIVHLPKMSYVSSGFRCEVNLDCLSERLEKAQYWLGEQVLQDCRAVMPHRTGSLQQRSHTENGGREVVFPGPYARYLYMGKVMVDSVTGKGPRKIPTGDGGYVLRFKKGAKLKATDRPLKYSNPEAKAGWFDEAKARNGEYWIRKAKEITGKG